MALLPVDQLTIINTNHLSGIQKDFSSLGFEFTDENILKIQGNYPTLPYCGVMSVLTLARMERHLSLFTAVRMPSPTLLYQSHFFNQSIDLILYLLFALNPYTVLSK